MIEFDNVPWGHYTTKKPGTQLELRPSLKGNGKGNDPSQRAKSFLVLF
jgi:hypothetical protein